MIQVRILLNVFLNYFSEKKYFYIYLDSTV